MSSSVSNKNVILLLKIPLTFPGTKKLRANTHTPAALHLLMTDTLTHLLLLILLYYYIFSFAIALSTFLLLPLPYCYLHHSFLPIGSLYCNIRFSFFLCCDLTVFIHCYDFLIRSFKGNLFGSCNWCSLYI